MRLPIDLRRGVFGLIFRSGLKSKTKQVYVRIAQQN